jgi:tetratricopeptide (TPR) repeat protein
MKRLRPCCAIPEFKKSPFSTKGFISTIQVLEKLRITLAKLTTFDGNSLRHIKTYSQKYPMSAGSLFVTALEEQSTAKRLDFLNDAIELDNRFSPAYLERSNVGIKIGASAKSIVEDCTSALEISPKLARAYGNRGRAYRMLKDYGRAFKNLNREKQIRVIVEQAVQGFPEWRKHIMTKPKR